VLIGDIVDDGTEAEYAAVAGSTDRLRCSPSPATTICASR
jgi:hypothetical protein